MPSVAVKVSGDLASAAKEAAGWADRSQAGQIEHWARLGAGIESHLSAKQVKALKTGPESEVEKAAVAEALEILAKVTENRDLQNAVAEELTSSKQTVYEAHPKDPELIVQVSPDGERTPGRLEGRKFVPVS